MKILLAIGLVICGIFGGSAFATDGHRQERVVERVIVKEQVREVPVEKIRVIERVVEDNHHHNRQNVRVERVVVERQVDNHHSQPQRQRSQKSVQKSKSSSKSGGIFGRLRGR